MLVLTPTFWASTQASGLTMQAQFALIIVGGLLMACTPGAASALVIDVVHPGMRATGSSVLGLTQNLLGLAVGPFVVGLLSDAYDLNTALAIVPAFSLLSAALFLLAARSYEPDLQRVRAVAVEADPIAAHGAPA